MSLRPVEFSKGRAHEPRLSKPYVPGRHALTYWSEPENDVIRKYYPEGGAAACLTHLPPHRTPSGVYGQAHKLGVSGAKERGGGKQAKVAAPADFDDQLRAAWPLMNGHKKGEMNAFADRLGVPRWWLTKRAIALGLTMPHKKEPTWSAAEDELLKRAPVHDLDKAAKFFREHGFVRSPTAINIRCKRKDISRRAARPTLSATAVAKILGIDGKGVTAEILRGDLKATKRADRRLPQQGGSSWDVTRADLKAFIVQHLERIDFRKVDKFEIVDLLTRPDEPGVPS